MNKLKKLPIGIQTFSEIRTEGYLYVDKTEYLCRLADEGKYYFLSRPRRFGKSLMLSTFRSMFEGKKELFEGLHVENNWDWERTSPILHFAFNALGYDQLGLEFALNQALDYAAKQYDIVLTQIGIGEKFKELISKLATRHGKVVLLIDEYDKPIIDYLTKDKIHRAKENQNILRSFYGIIKESDLYLRFVFITGISKFSQTSIFSQLNNLKDLTLHPDYSGIAGYTQHELKSYFTVYLENKLPRLKCTLDEAWSEIKNWYKEFLVSKRRT